MKKLFIAGSAGFIGRNLSLALFDQYKLLTPSHQELDLLNTEKVNQYIRNKQPDFIIHAANVGGVRGQPKIKNLLAQNLRIFFNLVSNQSRVKKIIYFGSGAEFDKSRPLRNVKEEEFDQKIPSDDYGFYKYICACYTQACKDKKIICLRLFGIYGPGENYLVRFISNAIVKNLLHLPITINQNVYFDYLYVEDLAPIVNYFLNHNSKYNIYNVTTGKRIDLKTIAKLVNKISDFPSQIIVKNPGLNNEYTGSNKRLLGEIKNLKFTPIEEGIKKLYEWYKKRLKTLDVQKIKQDPYIKYCPVKKIP